MERKSGFKECPRCGLRNKPSAAQCDFCGWEFRDVSDEWISHVQVLEKLNKATESIVLDDEVSKRIESTIVRGSRDAAPPPAPKPESKAPPVPTKREEISIEPEPKAKVEKWPERRVVTVPHPVPAEDNEVKNFVETMIGEPVAAQAAAVVNVQATETILRPMPAAEPLREESEFVQSTSGGFLARYHRAMLMAGIGLYAVTLVLYAISFLSVALGWGLAIAGALLITFGVSHIYDARMTRVPEGEAMIGKMNNSGDEVVICPRCHEEVSEKDSRCPSCGAAFSR